MNVTVHNDESEGSSENGEVRSLPPPPVSEGRLRRLCRKELREILRDRRTIITLVLMPLLVYPLLSIAFQRLLFTSAKSPGEVQLIIGLNDSNAKPRLERFLARGSALLQLQAAAERAAASPETAEPSATDSQTGGGDRPSEIRWMSGSNLEQEVTAGSLDLAILVDLDAGGFAVEDPRAPLDCRLIYRENSSISKRAYDYVNERLRVVNDHYLQQRLSELQQPIRLPVQVTSRTVGGSGAAFSLTTVIPLILILMTITGAVYPAIDLTAGERERGTLEALMAAPVPRMELLAAKYVAVVTVAVLTAGANLVAMTITLSATGLGALLFGPTGLSWILVVKIFALLMLSAGFYSAVLLALTSFARSFKEAQAYLIPLMLLSLAPGILSLMPGIEFNGPLAVAPLVNIVLLGRDLFEGSVDPKLAAASVLSTALYALAAIGLAARVFGNDAILYGSDASWSDLWSTRKAGRSAPSLSGTMLLLAILFPCSFVVSGLLARLPLDSLEPWFVFSSLAMVLLYIVLPVAALRLQRLPVLRTLRVRPAHVMAFVAAAVLGFSLWPWAFEIYMLNEWLGLQAIGEQHVEMVRGFLDRGRSVSPWLILAARAMAPAVCEEVLFRGFVFQSLLAAMSARRAIIASALLFGIFHVLTGNVLDIERFLPSTFMGLVLGWVCWRCGSVLPGMLLHACHNGLLLMVGHYQQQLQSRGWDVAGRHIPPGWLLASVASIAVSLLLVWFFAGRQTKLAGDRS